MNECIEREIPCPLFCFSMIKSVKDGMDHYNTCSNSKLKCETCGDLNVMRKHSKDHDCVKSIKMVLKKKQNECCVLTLDNQNKD